MSEIVPKKAAKAEAPPAAAVRQEAAPVAVVAKPVAAPLRSVQTRKFPPSSMQEMGHDYVTLTVTAPSDWDFEDVLKPVAFSNVCQIVARDALNTRRDKIGSIIEVRAADHAYFAQLYITGIALDNLGNPNGLHVKCIGPSRDEITGMPVPIDLRTGKPWSGR